MMAVLFCISVGFATGQDRKERDRKEPLTVPPPPPIPQEVKVRRGAEIIIPLRVYGRRNQVLTFLIRKGPRSGKVSGLKNTDADAAIVHYRPPDDHLITRDVFEYAVKSVEGVSAAVPVSIEILDDPPDLTGPAEVFYPPRLVGSSETQTVEIVNRGGQTAEGEARVDAPWRLEGDAKYRVEPNGRLFLKVTFTPEKPGEFLGEIRLSSQPGKVVILKGMSREALAVKPVPLRLGLEPATLVRAGAFELTNNTEVEQEVQIQSPERLLAEKTVRIGAGQSVPVMVRTRAEEPAAIDGELALKAGEHEARLRVIADPVPAVIRPVERTWDLGLLPGQTFPTHSFDLRNYGGVPGTVSLTAQPPIRLSGRPVTISPGETVRIDVSFEAGEAGPFEGAIQLRGPGPNASQSIPVRAVVMAPGNVPPRHAQSSESRSREETAASTPMPTSVHDLDLTGAVDSRRVVRTVLLERDRCTFEWHADLSPAPSFIAERRELSLQSGQFTMHWKRMPGLRIERSGGKVRATVGGLQPGQRYTLRLLGVNRDGVVDGLVAQTTITTPAPAKRGLKFSWLGTLSILAVILAGLAVWRRVQPPAIRPSAMKSTQKLKKTERIV